MTLEDEIIFFIQAKQKASTAKNDIGFKDRLNLLYAEGQISSKAYIILRQIFGYSESVKVAPEISKTAATEKQTNTTYYDPCGRGSSFSRGNGC